MMLTVHGTLIRSVASFVMMFEQKPSATENKMTDALKQQAMIEALEFYINNLKEINANQAAIDLFTEVLGDVEEEIW
jgi:hypothetical protein